MNYEHSLETEVSKYVLPSLTLIERPSPNDSFHHRISYVIHVYSTQGLSHKRL